MDKGFEFPIVRFVDSETALLEADNPDNKLREVIEDRIARLEGLQKMSSLMVARLRDRLK
jgi:hypothetical protein